MSKSFITLCCITFLVLLLSVFATANDIDQRVGNLTTKNEVMEKLYKEYSITPPSYYSPPEAGFIKEMPATLARFEKRMRKEYELFRKQTTGYGEIVWTPINKYILEPNRTPHNIVESSNSSVIVVAFPLHALPARIEFSPILP